MYSPASLHAVWQIYCLVEDPSESCRTTAWPRAQVNAVIEASTISSLEGSCILVWSKATSVVFPHLASPSSKPM